MASKRKLKLAPTKVRAPDVNPSGRVKGPLGFKATKSGKAGNGSREYSKIKPVQDPALEDGISTGFGMTGLTGES